jgi:hypothetical protein
MSAQTILKAGPAGGEPTWAGGCQKATRAASVVLLLVGTRFDPQHSARGRQLAERRLGNAVLLTHDGYGHLSSADPSRCVMQAIGRYLVDLSTPPPGTVCPSDRLPFDPEFGQPVP